MTMAKEFLGVGWKFPVNLDDGRIAVSLYEEDIREAIHIILGTSPGERVMRPRFGCGIRDFVFAAVNASTLSMIETSVREALILWEPRIEVTGVTVSTEKIKDGQLLIGIDYNVRTTNNKFNLVYPFYLTEGE